VLASTRLIAEAWDPGGLYQVGNFVGDSWLEWNGPFRDDVRSFLKGEPGMAPKLSERLLGSPDLFAHEQREPEESINFLTCHDGFTLNDAVSYNGKHNEANGEGNRDGSDNNQSWNCGVEGPTDDPAIERLRNRQVKNALAVLLFATGTPMLLMGDEVRRTQKGNNNAYCQDNELQLVRLEPRREARGRAALREDHDRGAPASSRGGGRGDADAQRVPAEHARRMARHALVRPALGGPRVAVARGDFPRPRRGNSPSTRCSTRTGSARLRAAGPRGRPAAPLAPLAGHGARIAARHLALERGAARLDAALPRRAALDGLPLQRLGLRRIMDHPICPACKAENDDEAAYCDQCGQPLTEAQAAEDAVEGGCPACGGVVDNRGAGLGVCRSCGLELREAAGEAPPAKADAGTVERLTKAILEKTGAGIPLEKAVAEGCREVFAAPRRTRTSRARPIRARCAASNARKRRRAARAAEFGSTASARLRPARAASAW